MKRMKIITDLNHLRKRCGEVSYQQSSSIALKMVSWLKNNNIDGTLGLACNQLGLGGRVILVRIGNRFQYFINPRIVELSESKMIVKEQCLSVPNVEVEVERSVSLTMEHDTFGFQNIGTGVGYYEGQVATIIQHEIDHLDGIVISDKLDVARSDDDGYI